MSERALHRAEVLAHAGRDAAALETLSRLDEESARAWALRAQCHLGLDAYVPALDAAQRALELDPDSEWAHRLASIAAAHQRQFALARRHADAAQAAAPWEWRAHLQRAEVDLDARAVGRDAQAAAQRALELAPEEPAVHNLRGRMALAAKDNKAAVAAFRDALRLNPDDAVARNNLAVAQLRRRRVGAAGAHLVAALRLDPSSRLAADNLRVVLRTWATMLSIAGFLGAWAIIESTRPRQVADGPTVPARAAQTLVVGSRAVTIPGGPQYTLPGLRSVPVHGRPAVLVGIAVVLVAALLTVAVLMRRSIGRNAARVLVSSMRRDILLLGTVVCCVGGIACVVLAAAIGLPAGHRLVVAALAVNIVVVLLTRLLTRATRRRRA